MNGRLTITTSKNEIYFYTTCEYNYTKSGTAQINFVYESDFRKYNIVLGLNKDKLSLSITTLDEGEQESSFNVMGISHGGPIRHTTVELEYWKFNFSQEDVSVDYCADFANLVLPCSYVTLTKNPRTTIMKISCKIAQENKE